MATEETIILSDQEDATVVMYHQKPIMDNDVVIVKYERPHRPKSTALNRQTRYQRSNKLLDKLFEDGGTTCSLSRGSGDRDQNDTGVIILEDTDDRHINRNVKCNTENDCILALDLHYELNDISNSTSSNKLSTSLNKLSTSNMSKIRPFSSNTFVTSSDTYTTPSRASTATTSSCSITRPSSSSTSTIYSRSITRPSQGPSSSSTSTTCTPSSSSTSTTPSSSSTSTKPSSSSTCTKLSSSSTTTRPLNSSITIRHHSSPNITIRPSNFITSTGLHSSSKTTIRHHPSSSTITIPSSSNTTMNFSCSNTTCTYSLQTTTRPLISSIKLNTTLSSCSSGVPSTLSGSTLSCQSFSSGTCMSTTNDKSAIANSIMSQSLVPLIPNILTNPCRKRTKIEDKRRLSKKYHETYMSDEELCSSLSISSYSHLGVDSPAVQFVTSTSEPFISIDIPSWWIPSSLNIVDVILTDNESKLVSYPLEQSGFTVFKVERIQSPHLWKRYLGEVKLLIQSRGDAFQLNEKVLYHCSRADKTVICIEGLDVRLGVGGNFGRGIYFSDKPFKCHCYSHGTRIMYACKVILGDIKEYNYGESDGNLIREPPNNSGTYYDSVKGFIRFGEEYVIYNNYRCIPLYIITYG